MYKPDTSDATAEFDPAIQLVEKPCLLVIDDQPTNIRIIHELFQSEMKVIMATSGEAGLSIARRTIPDIILLDVLMESMDGYEVCRQLKNDPQLKNIPVIFITAKLDEEDEVKGFNLGAVDFIRKPINSTITKVRVNTHLVHKQQQDLLRGLALLDGLTGIANRRKFDAELNSMWRHCLREQTPLVLIMIDIDYFKQFNDHYGHAQGDWVLRSMARCLNGLVGRPQDLVARVGGEEFVILLPNTALNNISGILDKLFLAIRELNIPHEKSPFGQLTISAGYAGVIPDSESLCADLYNQADSALYMAKEKGRNQYQQFGSDL